MEFTRVNWNALSPTPPTDSFSCCQIEVLLLPASIYGAICFVNWWRLCGSLFFYADRAQQLVMVYITLPGKKCATESNFYSAQQLMVFIACCCRRRRRHNHHLSQQPRIITRFKGSNLTIWFAHSPTMANCCTLMAKNSSSFRDGSDEKSDFFFTYSCNGLFPPELFFVPIVFLEAPTP